MQPDEGSSVDVQPGGSPPTGASHAGWDAMASASGAAAHDEPARDEVRLAAMAVPCLAPGKGSGVRLREQGDASIEGTAQSTGAGGGERLF